MMYCSKLDQKMRLKKLNKHSRREDASVPPGWYTHYYLKKIGKLKFEESEVWMGTKPENGQRSNSVNIPALLELTSSFDHELYPTSGMTFHLSLHPYQRPHL